MAAAVTTVDDPQAAVLDLQQQAGPCWIVWYGAFTKHYWAAPTSSHPWYGLCEATTPVGLLARIGEVDAYYGTPSTRRRP